MLYFILFYFILFYLLLQIEEEKNHFSKALL